MPSIPRGVHFLPDLFPQILIPRNHATPYRDPQTGEDAPFITVGPFVSTDTLFHGTAGDLELYTAKEAIALRNARVFKSLNTGLSTPRLPSLASLGQVCLPLGISNHLTTIQRWNQTPLPGSETTEVLQGATGVLYPRQLEVAKTWISWNMNVRPHASNSIERLMQSTGIEKGVGSMRSAIAPKTGICTMGAPLDMSAVLCSSVTDPLTWVLPVSVPTRRSGELKEAGLANAGTCVHQSTFASCTSFLPFHPRDFTSHIHRFTWHSVFRHEQGISSSR